MLTQCMPIVGEGPFLWHFKGKQLHPRIRAGNRVFLGPPGKASRTGHFWFSYALRKIYIIVKYSSSYSSSSSSRLCHSKSRFPFCIGLPCRDPWMCSTYVAAQAWQLPIPALPQLSRQSYSPNTSTKRRLLSHIIMIFVQGGKILTSGGAPRMDHRASPGWGRIASGILPCGWSSRTENYK